MLKSIIILLIPVLVVTSCSPAPETQLKQGWWHGEMRLMQGKVLPLPFQVVKEEGLYKLIFNNAEETLESEAIELSGDSIVIRMPVFEGYFAGQVTDSTIHGNFIKESLSRVVPFEASFGEKSRFAIEEAPSHNIGGTWEAVFGENTDDHYVAKGIFKQKGQLVTGTFRTTTGDYRFLEGVVSGDSLKLSAFDGAHVFLFLGRVSDSTMQGTFYSGNHYINDFTAIRNESYELPDADSLTFLKEGYDKLSFAFPTEDGTIVSPDDDKYKGKVLVVQVMGTWCPNCMDETKFLVSYLQDNPHPDLEVMALAFEYAPTEEKAFAGIRRMKERWGVDYPVLLAQYGSSSKLRANEKLPMLNHVLSYPTTIVIDKKGQVRNIHTGFNGPATGKAYEEFTKEFDALLSRLLSE